MNILSKITESLIESAKGLFSLWFSGRGCGLSEKEVYAFFGL